MKNILRSCLLAGFLFPAIAFAQPYSWQETTSTYTPLTGATSINNGSVWSSFQSFTVPIGFSFSYMGSNFTTIFIEGSGFTRFDANYYFLLMPFTAQLEDKGTSTSLSPLSYQLAGNSPNRILKIEWSNCGFVNDAASTANFQLWLYETSNEIEIHVGACTVVNPAQAYTGNAFPGPVCGLFRYTSLTNCTYGHTVMGTPPAENDSVFSGPAVDLFDYSLNGTPQANTVYRFTPAPNGIDDPEQTAFLLYPNPVSDRLHISGTEAANVTIFDALGKPVLSKRMLPAETIDMGGFAPGLYFVEMRTETEVFRSRIVKR